MPAYAAGFAAQPEEKVKAVDKDLMAINARLEQYREQWDSFVDAWLVIRVEDPG